MFAMIYLSNFFARGVEAVSIQVEAARLSPKDPIISCGYFLDQKILSLSDIKDNIWIFPKWLFPLVSTLVISFSRQGIHYFEDEPSSIKKILLNLRCRPVYISLFKDVTPALINYLKGLHFLEGVTVETAELEARLKRELPNVNVLRALPQPLWDDTKVNDPDHTFVFASWNGGSKIALHERGVVNILKLCKAKALSCVIVLRDGQIGQLKKYIKGMGLGTQIKLLSPGSKVEVCKAFNAAEYVIMLPEKPVMKGVPNSVIDGLALGKPCLISSCLGFAKEVKNDHMGIVWDTNMPVSHIRLPDHDGYKKLQSAGRQWVDKNIRPYKLVMKELYEKF